MTRYLRGVSRRYLRPGVVVGHLLVLAAALTCLRLGWWQWNVFEESRGTAQNLGYALLWPVFAGSFIYMWLRFLQLEGTRTEPGDRGGAAGERDENAGVTADSAVDDHDGAAGSAQPAASDAPANDDEPGRGRFEAGPAREPRHTRSSASDRATYTVGMGYIGDDDDEDDPELAAYNRALAALAEQDERRDR